MKRITNYEILIDFLNYNSELELGSFSKKNLFNANWIKFNRNLAGSLVSFYKFSYILSKRSKATYEDLRFYNFYTDHIIANPSSQIFTETPRSSEFDLFPIDSKIIAYDANYIMDLTKESNFSYDNSPDYNIFFHKLYIETFCYFDFVFSVKKQEGVFTNFGYSKKIYEEFDKCLSSFLDKNSNIDFKELLNKLKVINIDIAMNLYANKIKKYDSKYLKELIQHTVYTEYVENVKKLKNTRDRDRSIKFEIFTYILSHKLWKIERIYHNTPEFTTSDRDSIYSEFLEKTKKYIKKQLQLIGDFYNKKYDLGSYLYEVYKEDKEYIGNYLFVDFLCDITEENSVISETDSYKLDLINNNESYDIAELINRYIIKDGEKEKFKFFRLIQDAKSDEIIYLIQYFYEYIKKNTEDINNSSFIGILRSGAFLAHVLHILKIYDSKIENKYKYSYFIITYPYISIIPRHVISRSKDNDKGNEDHLAIIYIDEAIKSGYSLAVADIYRKRVLESKKITKSDKDIAFSLTNFTDYDNKIIDKKPTKVKYKSIVNITFDNDNRTLEAKQVNEQLEIKETFNWKEFLSKLKFDTNNIKKQATTKINEKIRYDLIRNLADSESLFFIAKEFYEKLYKKINLNSEQNYTIIFYAGSPEGNLLIDTMVFVWKILSADYKNIKFISNGKNYHNKLEQNRQYYTIFVDISIVTESTKSKVWNLDVSNYLKKIKTNKEEKFDYTCCIYNGAIDKNDKDVYIFEDDKE